MKASRVWFILLAVLVLVACAVPLTPSPSTLPTVVRVVGSSDMAPLLPTLRQRLTQHVPAADVRYVPTNSSTGLRLLREGQADIALVSYLPNRLPPGLTALPLGEDDVVIIVYPDVEVSHLPLEKVRRLFQGRYLSWAELGGPDLPIRLVSREEGSGTRAIFERVVMANTPVALTAVVMPSAQDVVHYVQRHEGAIGYVGRWVVNDHVRLLAIDDEAATQALHRTLYMVTSDRFAFLGNEK